MFAKLSITCLLLFCMILSTQTALGEVRGVAAIEAQAPLSARGALGLYLTRRASVFAGLQRGGEFPLNEGKLLNLTGQFIGVRFYMGHRFLNAFSVYFNGWQGEAKMQLLGFTSQTPLSMSSIEFRGDWFLRKMPWSGVLLMSVGGHLIYNIAPSNRVTRQVLGLPALPQLSLIWMIPFSVRQ